MKSQKRQSLYTFLIILAILIIYSVIYYFLRKYYITSCNNITVFKNNEFADFFGGVVNPFFTLISTVAIIILTIKISQNESTKAEKAIQTQKRLTLNQMRQSAFQDISQKTNMYIYEYEKLKIYSTENKFTQNVLTHNIKKEHPSNEKIAIWLIILNELENFNQLQYLFDSLFTKEEFIQKYNLINEITATLCEEQAKMLFVQAETIKKYVSAQREFLTEIGSFIYSEF